MKCHVLVIKKNGVNVFRENNNSISEAIKHRKK